MSRTPRLVLSFKSVCVCVHSEGLLSALLSLQHFSSHSVRLPFLCIILWRPVTSSSAPARTLTLGLVLLVVPFLPACNIFFRVGFVIAERVLYLSSAGYCLLLAYALGHCCCRWSKYRVGLQSHLFKTKKGATHCRTLSFQPRFNPVTFLFP